MLDRGVPHRDIRKAISVLEERYGDWPLSEAPWPRGGYRRRPDEHRARVVLRAAEADYDVGNLGWQQVLEPENLEQIRRQLARWGWAVRTLPDHIEVDPERLRMSLRRPVLPTASSCSGRSTT